MNFLKDLAVSLLVLSGQAAPSHPLLFLGWGKDVFFAIVILIVILILMCGSLRIKNQPATCLSFCISVSVCVCGRESVLRTTKKKKQLFTKIFNILVL